MNIDADKIKSAATGRWREILSCAGVDHSVMDGKHHPCPLCGGTDRFRFDDKEGRGTWFCNQCGGSDHSGGAGDGLELAHRLNGGSFPDTLKMVAQIIGVTTDTPSQKKIKPREVKAYDYHNADGDVLFQVVRMEPKGFTQRQPDGKGGWIKNIQGIEPVLYRLPEVLQAHLVLVCEGEKDADTAVSMGYTATTAPMGAGKWRDSYTKALAGKDVVIIPDKDEAGEKHALKVTKALTDKCSSIKQVDIPAPHNDLTDWHSAGGNAQELQKLIEMAKPPTTVENPFSLSKFSLRGKSEEMEKQMLESVHVLGRMALVGQSTIFYAPTNTGKTLITIWLLIESINKGNIKGENVFYINADDSYRGLTEKLKLAEKYGFEMLSPGYEGFEAVHLVEHLKQISREDTAREKVLILDTVKKFTDPMSKSDGREFGQIAREFVLKGGTLVMLAHTNKHRNPEGKLVYQGTTDLMDDADCSYIMDTEVSTYRKNVIFENTKCRGDVDTKAVYSYDHSQGKSHLERLDSVQRVDEKEQKALEEQRNLKRVYERNLEAIEAIEEVLKDGAITKTELINKAHENSSISKKRIRDALREHTGNDILKLQYWIKKVGDKNANIYQLNDMRRVKKDSDFWSGEGDSEAV